MKRYLTRLQEEIKIKIKILDKFLQGHKGFVAGGCFKNILNNEHIKDIDVFI